MSFDQVVLENPIAAACFILLRHSCDPDLMDTLGYVPLSVVSAQIGYSVDSILTAVHAFNITRTPHSQMTIDDDGKGQVIIKANTCHSIDKVQIPTTTYSPSFREKGYVFLRKDTPYVRGSDLVPCGKRNDIVLRFPRYTPFGPRLEINLWGLARKIPIEQFDDTGLLIRGSIPAKYITMLS